MLPPFLEGKSHSMLIMGIYFAINVVLNCLNIYWFFSIIQSGSSPHHTKQHQS